MWIKSTMKVINVLICLMLALSLSSCHADNEENPYKPQISVQGGQGTNHECDDVAEAPSITIRGEQFSTASTELDLSWMDLTDEEIVFLADLVKLESLSLLSNRISDLTPLSELANLRGLNAEDNQINDVLPLADMIGLRRLFLKDNQISDLTPLSGLVNLKKLDLRGNQISDWSPVAHVDWVDGHP